MQTYRVLLRRTRIIQEYLMLIATSADEKYAAQNALSRAESRQWTADHERITAPVVSSVDDLGETP